MTRLSLLSATLLVGIATAHDAQAAGKSAKEVFRAEEKVIFQDDFQSGSLARWNISEDDRYNLPANTPERLQIVDAPGLAAGRKAVRFVVPRAPDSFRAEISLPHEKGFRERWYAARILVPKEWVIERHAKGNDIVIQWHAIPGKGTATYPNLEISVGGDRWFLRQSFGTALASPTRKNQRLGVVKPGVWTAWVIHARWSPGDDGLLQAWQNGELVFEAKGPNVYGDIGVEYTPYMKTGIYHPEWHLDTDRKRAVFAADQPDATSRTTFVTDIKVGSERARYEDVAPR